MPVQLPPGFVNDPSGPGQTLASAAMPDASAAPPLPVPASSISLPPGFVDDPASTSSPSPQTASDGGPASGTVHPAEQLAAELHAPGASGLLDFDHAKILYDFEKQKSFGTQAKEFGAGAAAGFGQIGKDVRTATKEGVDPRNWLRQPGSVAQGVVQGAASDAELVRKTARAAYDLVRDRFSTDAERITHFRDRYNENLISERALAQGNNAEHELVPGMSKVLGKPLPGSFAMGQNFGDPITIGTMGAGGAVGKVGAKLAGAVPGGARALELAAAARAVPGKVLAKVPGAVEAAGAAVKRAAGLPEEWLAEKAGSVLPKETAHLLGTGAAAAGLLHGGPLGKAVAALKGTAWAGKAAEMAGAFSRHLVETQGESVIPRLVQVATTEGAPEWIKTLAGAMHDLGVGKAGQVAGNLAESGLHGFEAGAVLGELGGENQGEAGQMAGAGAGFGMLGRGARMASGMEGRAQQVMTAMRARAMLLDHALTPADKGGLGLTPEQAAKIGDFPALVAGYGLQLFRGQVKFAFHEPGDAAALGGKAGAVAWYDPATKTIHLPFGDTSNRSLHEIMHPLAQAIGADAEARLLIDSVFTPERIGAMGKEYAASLGTTPEALTATHAGDKWLYDEIFADAGYGAMRARMAQRGPRAYAFLPDILGTNRTIWERLGDRMRGETLNTFGDFFDRDGKPVVPRGAIFSNPEIYHNRALRQLVYEHLRKVARFGERAGLQGGDEGAPVAVPRKSLGKSPAAPKDMLVENGMFMENVRTGELAPSPKLEKQRDKAKTAEVLDKVVKQPVKAKGDTSPEVGPRVNDEGKVEVSGTKISAQLGPAFGPWAKKVADFFEGLMGSGKAGRVWYFPVYEGGKLAKGGDLPAKQIDLAPFRIWVDQKGHVLITGLSVSAAERKLARWQSEGKLEQLWSGDANAFRADLLTYLKNHAEGRPGAETLGDKKRDALNTFVIGKAARLAEMNPLRAGLRGQDRAGIIRDLRLDRISTTEPSPHEGWHAAYKLKPINFSPGTSNVERRTSNSEQGGRRADERVPGRKLLFRPEMDNGNLAIVTPGGQPVGSVWWRPAGKKTVEIEHLEVSENCQRQGLGEALLRELVRRLPTVYPEVQFVTGNATSRGVVRLLGRVLGREFSGAEFTGLPKTSPEDWRETGNRAQVRYRLPEAAAGERQFSPEVKSPDAEAEARYQEWERTRAAYEATPWWKQPPTGEAETARHSSFAGDAERGVVLHSGKQRSTVFLRPARAADFLGKWEGINAESAEGGREAQRDALVESYFTEGSAQGARQFQYSPEVEGKNVRQPNEEVRKLAAGYMAMIGREYLPHSAYEPLDAERGKRVADAYQAAAHEPEKPEVKAAYAAMARETVAQFDYLVKHGYRFEPWVKSGQPYKSSAEMRADVRDHKHLWFFPTASGFGSDVINNIHPLLEQTGREVNGTPLNVNDIFRAVHDFFGHAKEGYEFGPRGEYNAYVAHARMYSDEALPAMAAETMGQNSWVNFGKHLRNAEGNVPVKGEPGYVPQQERPYAEQKATTLRGTESGRVGEPESGRQLSGRPLDDYADGRALDYKPKDGERLMLHPSGLVWKIRGLDQHSRLEYLLNKDFPDEQGKFARAVVTGDQLVIDEDFNGGPFTPKRLRAFGDMATEMGLAGVTVDNTMPDPRSVQFSGRPSLDRQREFDKLSPHGDSDLHTGVGERVPREIDTATGVPSFYVSAKTGPGEARRGVEEKAAAAKARDLAADLLEEDSRREGSPAHASLRGGSFDRLGTWRELAKDASRHEFGDATRRAQALLFMDRARFEQEKANQSHSAGVFKSAEVARAELPVIRDESPLGSFMEHRTGSRFKIISDADEGASEGWVVRDRFTGFVYKLMKPAFHLARIGRRERAANKLTFADSDTLLDTLSKVDRQSRIPGGLPIEVQGLMVVKPQNGYGTDENCLVLKMPLMRREATSEEVGDFMRQHAWEKAASEQDVYGRKLTAASGEEQPIAKDAHGNSYAVGDVRWWRGKYPNFMVGPDGKTYAMDVMFRPIDAADVAGDKGLARYAPKDESQLLYSPHGQGEMGGETRADEPRALILKTRKALLALAKQNPEAVRPKLIPATGRVQKVGYDLADSPLVERAGREAAIGTLAGKVVREVSGYAGKPEIMEAKDWYPRIRSALRNTFGAQADMVGQLLAATSARTGVVDNFKASLEALRLYSQGHYDGLLQRYAEYVDSHDGNDRGFAEVPLKENGRKFNANSRQVLRVLGLAWAEKAGLKTKQFYENLAGLDSGATVDVWAARTMRRLSYASEEKGEPNRWRILPVSEKAVAPKDFRFSQAVLAEAARRLNLTPEAVQSLLWFGEKDLWERKGWTRGAGAAKSSFGDEMTKLSGENLPGELGLDLTEQKPRRVQLGLTDFTDEKEFTLAGHVQFMAEMRQFVRKLPGLMAMRVQHTDALYGGTEPSVDMEATFNNRKALENLDRQTWKWGQEKKQTDVMFSEVVARSHPNARPGIEVIFKRPIRAEELGPILQAVTGAGLDGMTPFRDARGRVTGFRAQFCPEISARWADPERQASLLDPGQFEANAAEWKTRGEKALDAVAAYGVRSSGFAHYDTRVYGKEDTFYPERGTAQSLVAGELRRRGRALAGR